MLQEKMTAFERKAVFSIASIMSLRMIGLFMVLPVFSLYALTLEGATPTLIGIAIGVYGLAQAICQIPFGILSDHFGRKPIIFFGLLVFILGSFIAATSQQIEGLLIGRTLQGVGAIGSTLLALLADLTRDQQRSKAMAFAGMAIGLSFACAMVLGPMLTRWLSVPGLFYCAMGFGCIAIGLLLLVPTPRELSWQSDTAPELKSFIQLLTHKELYKLNAGIFILHALFTANFIAIPFSLKLIGFDLQHQWLVYLPTLFLAFLISFICIGLSEKRSQIKPFFLLGIFCLIIAQVFFWQGSHHRLMVVLGLGTFFTGFSILEAFLPSLISRTAPPRQKGSALGIYSCTQFLGIFMGGVLGGWLFGHFNLASIYLFCFLLALIWLSFAFFMRLPSFLVTQLLPLTAEQKNCFEDIRKQLEAIPGIMEINLSVEENFAYLKMERNTRQHPDFLTLKEQLQSD